MAWFLVARASRRLQSPSLVPSSVSTLGSILNPLPPSSDPTPTPAPAPIPGSNYYSPLRKCYRRTLISDFACEKLNLDWGHRSVAHISTSVKERSNGEEDNDGESKAEVSWIDSYLPNQARPYARLARLDKPIGSWLLAWPSMWSITLAASPGHLPDFKMLMLLGCGAVFIRGAACTINDILDRDIDRMVERTKLRPIASGLLSPFQGLCFLRFQLLLGLGILLQLNNYRVTYWPQAYLGLTFSWGALLGWAAIKGSVDPAIVFPLYISGVFWTLVYDTIYVHQDKEDDIKVGVKSTALRFGDSTKMWTTAFGIACISSLALSGFNAGIGGPYYAFLAAASGHLAWQIWTVDLSSPADCSRKFVSNKWFGAIIFSGILFGKLCS